jgi:hypothetical protein
LRREITRKTYENHCNRGIRDNCRSVEAIGERSFEIKSDLKRFKPTTGYTNT